jgi:hypothetical protein
VRGIREGKCSGGYKVGVQENCRLDPGPNSLSKPSGASRAEAERLASKGSRLKPLPVSTIPCGCASGGAARFEWLLRVLRKGRRGTGIDGVETSKYFIGSVLQPCIRLVQLPGCLARQLTELITIGHMRKCPKYQIRTHYVILLQEIATRPDLSAIAGAAGLPDGAGSAPKFIHRGIRRTKWPSSSKS